MTIYDNCRSSFTPTERSREEDAETRPWITAEGRGETCRTCQTQIDVRHVLGDDGNCVTLCAGCRAVFFDGGTA